MRKKRGRQRADGCSLDGNAPVSHGYWFPCQLVFPLITTRRQNLIFSSQISNRIPKQLILLTLSALARQLTVALMLTLCLCLWNRLYITGKPFSGCVLSDHETHTRTQWPLIITVTVSPSETTTSSLAVCRTSRHEARSSCRET